MAESIGTGGSPERKPTPAESWGDFLDRRGAEINAQRETHEQERQKKMSERRERGGGGLVEAGAGVVGLGLIGGLWTIEKALKYALLGWKIDSNGWPQFDKESLARFDKWYEKAAGRRAA